jgi:hypothetical protein
VAAVVDGASPDQHLAVLSSAAAGSFDGLQCVSKGTGHYAAHSREPPWYPLTSTARGSSCFEGGGRGVVPRLEKKKKVRRVHILRGRNQALLALAGRTG